RRAHPRVPGSAGPSSEGGGGATVEGQSGEEQTPGCGCLLAGAVSGICLLAFIGALTQGEVGSALICLAVSLLAGIGAARGVSRPSPAAVARRRPGRYVCPCDLQGIDRALVVRAATAVEAITTSQAHRRDVVDSARNTVELPHTLWQIAKDTEKISALAMKHRQALTSSPGTAVDTVLASQNAALTTSRDAVTARVTALEEYARQARGIDALLAQQDRLEELEQSNQDYLDLVAETSADAFSVGQAEDASRQAAVASTALAEAVQRARDAAELALPADS
ncbi:hypothetical protein, partial [Streptomyces sp. NPDC127084]|uniref:hypothetical protein n=1 Tax=Streptomyces sp. NPDC127084 TaxID=3347133 RepID=UPI003650BECB